MGNDSNAVQDYLDALAGFEEANKLTEKAREEEDTQHRKLQDAKMALAKAVGYEAGDHPLGVIVPGEKKMIRFYTVNHGRGCGGPGGYGGRENKEIHAVIERVA